MGFLALIPRGAYKWLAVGAAVAALGVYIWVQGLRLAAAEEKIGSLRDQVSAKQAEIDLLADNRDRLASALEQQTKQVRALQAAAATTEEAAAATAREILQGADALAQTDAAAGSDPKDMNRWLQELFH